MPAYVLIGICVLIVGIAVGTGVYNSFKALSHDNQIQAELQAACERNNEFRSTVNNGLTRVLSRFISAAIFARRETAKAALTPRLRQINRQAAKSYTQILADIALPLPLVDCAAVYPPL